MKNTLILVMAFLTFNTTMAMNIRAFTLIGLISSEVVMANETTDLPHNTIEENGRLDKSKIVTLALCWFGGIHHFYLKNNITGVIYILALFAGGLGMLLNAGDFFTFLFMSDQEWKDYLKSDKSVPWL